MAYSLIVQILSPAENNAPSDYATGVESNENYLQSSSFIVASCVMIIPLFGVVFFFKEAWDQRDRLELLDSQKLHESKIPDK
jgi:hypothetical protein